MSRSSRDTPPLKGPARPVLVALFFLSGLSGLGCQVVWAKMFAAGIGHEYPAMLAVVSAFMAGMAAGAWGVGRYRSRLGSSTYGWLELVIGGWAWLTIWIIPAANTGVIHLLGAAPPFALHWTVVFLAVFLVLLPATAAMGATLPALEWAITHRNRQGSVGLLYASNTAGAMVGILLTAYVSMPLLGLFQSVAMLGSVSVGCGAVAIWLLKGLGEVPKASSPVTRRLPTLFGKLFFTGLLGLGYEIVGIRALSHILENTVFTFAVVVAVYLLGTFAGALAFNRLTRKPTVDQLVAGLAISTLLGGLSLWLADSIYMTLRGWFETSRGGVALAEMTLAALVFLVPTVLMGALFTCLAEELKERAGVVYSAVAWNSLGGALAPLLAGLILIPQFGLRGGFWVVAAGYAAMAKGKLRMGALAILALGIFLPGTQSLLHTSVREKVVFLRDGVMASVAVLENPAGERVLKVNNRFQMGGTAARVAEQRQADIPLLLHPDPRSALFIGLGTGITAGTALLHPGVTTEAVELLPEVVEAMPLFWEQPASSGKMQVWIADGRRFVQSATNQYDVIVADLFHPAQDGAGFLYTLEHFRAMKARLKEGGLLCQWLPVYQLDRELLRIIVRTFLEVFPGSEAWLLRFNAETPVIGLIARGGRDLSPDVGARRPFPPTLSDHLRKVGLGDMLRLEGCWLAGADQLRAFSAGARVNRDGHPVILFQAPLVAFQKQDQPAKRLSTILEEFGVPGAFPPDFKTEPHTLRAFLLARNTYFAGLAAEEAGDQVAALSAYLESARQSEDFTAGYAQCLVIASALAKENPAAARKILLDLNEAQPGRPAARDLLERLQL